LIEVFVNEVLLIFLHISHKNIDEIVVLSIVMDYRIIRGATPKKLGRKVRERISKGWKPTGGVSAVYHSETNSAISFYQAIIK